MNTVAEVTFYAQSFMDLTKNPKRSLSSSPLSLLVFILKIFMWHLVLLDKHERLEKSISEFVLWSTYDSQKKERKGF